MNKKFIERFAAWILLAALLGMLGLYNIIPLTPALVLIIISSAIMIPRALLKNWRILVWMFFIIIAVVLIAPNPAAHGFVITGVDKSSPVVASVGQIVYAVNGVPATQDTFVRNYEGVVQVDINHLIKYANVNGTLGLSADPVPTNRLTFGLDIKGGVRAVLQPNTTDNATLDQVITTLQTRINVYGLREAIFRPVYYGNQGFVEISIAGGSKEELQNLIERQGKFEAKIPFTVPVSGNAISLNLDKTYSIPVDNNSLVVDGAAIAQGQPFTLAGINFVYNAIQSGKANMTATVFTGSDVVTVFIDPQHSQISPVSGGYQWNFGVQLSNKGAQNFAWITQNTNMVQGGSLQNCYLDAPISFYLDNKFVDSLSISCSLKGKAETQISISGPAATMADAINARNELQSILKSGALPTTVQIVQLDSISPTLGTDFLRTAVLAALAAIIGVIAVVSVRYRHPKLVLPMVAISMSEVLIVLGIAVLINWTIDLAAIAGLIASVGTGIDSQIIILDRTLRKEEQKIESLREKLRNAFFVVFGAAGTVIAAMLPLLFVFGLLRGFAIVTIIGVLVGVLLARPAYGKILEYMTKE